ncbi:Hydrogen cyanide synthase subunit HcnA [Ensifer psoraleae]|uniref:(2Fe-2S)-binding protein n=1 Tax=Sinorhizobium psoraleae TaxID=520838 RepID=UPI001567F5D2|nr:(2Fe-2S)-binding protein [Sinorhizobium psoraleae]NRP70911.1 Hydrogen cyanide synthase subunit HcnA [Sinorhizobium psoraleae]
MNNPHETTNRLSSMSLNFEGCVIAAREGETVATALLAAKAGYTGTSQVSGRRRSPYCLTGICFECLVEVNGHANQRACMVRVRKNMTIRRQNRLPSLHLKGRET